MCDKFPELHDIGVLSTVFQPLASGQVYVPMNHAETRAVEVVSRSIELAEVGQGYRSVREKPLTFRKDYKTLFRMARPMPMEIFSGIVSEEVLMEFYNKEVRFIGSSPSILGATPIKRSDKGFTKYSSEVAVLGSIRDIRLITGLEASEIWVYEFTGFVPGYQKTGKEINSLHQYVPVVPKHVVIPDKKVPLIKGKYDSKERVRTRYKERFAREKTVDIVELEEKVVPKKSIPLRGLSSVQFSALLAKIEEGNVSQLSKVERLVYMDVRFAMQAKLLHIEKGVLKYHT